MASAFRSGLGRGIAQGVQQGTANFINMQQLGMQRQQLADATQERQLARETQVQQQLQKRQQFFAGQAQEDIATLAGDVRTAVENNQPEVAQRLVQAWTSPMESAGGMSRLGMRVETLRQAGLPATEQGIMADIQALASGAVTGEEAAAAEMRNQMAGAETVADAYGVSPRTAAQGAGLLPAPQQPSIGAEIAPIYGKLRRGEPLTPGEQQALQIYETTQKTEVNIGYDAQGRPVQGAAAGTGMVGGQPAAGAMTAQPTPGGGTEVQAQVVTPPEAAPTPGPARAPLGPTLPGAQPFVQDQRLTHIDNTLGLIDEQIANISEDPTDYGILGSVRGSAQELVGIAEDLASFTGESRVAELMQGLTGKMGEALYDPNLPEIERIENILATRLAIMRSTRPGNTSRALKSFLDDAKKEVNLRGMTSSRDVSEALQSVRRLFDEERSSLIQSLSGQAPASGGAAPQAQPQLTSPEPPIPGSRTAVNPATGEAVYFDEEAGRWVPY